MDIKFGLKGYIGGGKYKAIIIRDNKIVFHISVSKNDTELIQYFWMRAEKEFKEYKDSKKQ